MRKVVLAMFGVSAFAAPGLLAQQHTPPTPAMVVERIVAHLTKELTLDPTVQTEASACFLPAVTSDAALQTTLRANRKLLQTDLENDDLGGIATELGAISMVESEIPGNNATAEVCFTKLLNATQLAMLAKGHGGFGLGFGGGPGGGPGGFGGRGPR